MNLLHRSIFQCVFPESYSKTSFFSIEDMTIADFFETEHCGKFKRNDLVKPCGLSSVGDNASTITVSKASIDHQ